MKTPSPVKGEGAERCLGESTLCKSLSKQQHLRTGNIPSIILDGCQVHIVGGPDRGIGIPRRQGFAWPANASEYAERLSSERGWPIEAKHGGR